MSNHDATDLPPALAAFAQRVLSTTGLTTADVIGTDPAAEGSAEHALRHGWDMARRSEQVQP
jgi:hypothetical protein